MRSRRSRRSLVWSHDVCPPFSLTFDGDYVLSDLVLQGQVIDALDQVVDRVNVGVDRLEPMDLCPDGRWVGQNKLRARRAGLGSLARDSPRTELAGPWARGRSGSELGRDGLGHRDGNCHRDRAWSGHGRLRLLRETGPWDARLEIHLSCVFSLSLSLPLVSGGLTHSGRSDMHTRDFFRGGGGGGGRERIWKRCEQKKSARTDGLENDRRRKETHQ